MSKAYNDSRKSEVAIAWNVMNDALLILTKNSLDATKGECNNEFVVTLLSCYFQKNWAGVSERVFYPPSSHRGGFTLNPSVLPTPCKLFVP